MTQDRFTSRWHGCFQSFLAQLYATAATNPASVNAVLPNYVQMFIQIIDAEDPDSAFE